VGSWNADLLGCLSLTGNLYYLILLPMGCRNCPMPWVTPEEKAAIRAKGRAPIH
jgi:hypothetical protein